MSGFEICNFEEFVADVTPQSGSLEEAASTQEILIQQIEGYLARMKAALCADVEALRALIDENSFLELTDTPASYAGAAGQVATVNAGEDALEFAAPATSGLPDLDDDTEVASDRDFNGNPTFFKLVNIGTLPNTTSKSVAHNIANPFVLVQGYGVANDPAAALAIPLIFSAHSSLTNTVWFNTTSTNVVVTTGSNRTAFTESWVILEYYYR